MGVRGSSCRAIAESRDRSLTAGANVSYIADARAKRPHFELPNLPRLLAGFLTYETDNKTKQVT